MAFLNVVVSTQGSAAGRGGFVWTSAAGRWAKASGPIAREAIRKRAPVGKTVNARGKQARSGALKDSVADRYSSSAGVSRVEIGTSASYASFVVKGTGPHVIVPRNARVLYFQVGGVGVFARRVNHPGTRANDFPGRAMKAVLPGIRTSFTEIMREAMGGMP
jgi:hypothetical protein